MTVEKLEINVTTKTNGSETKIKNLADALGQLEAKAAALTGISNLSALATAMQSISGTKVTASAFNGIAKGIENLSAALKAITADDLDRLKTLSNTLRSLNNIDLSGVGNASSVSRAARSLHDTARGIDDVSSSAKKAKTPLETFVASLKRIAFYRLLRTVIKEITQAFKEGLENAYEWSKAVGGDLAPALDRIASASLQMKNQLGAALGELLIALEPIIVELIHIITALAEAFTWLFATLNGKSEYTVATEAATEWKKADKAAKEYQRTILGFDVINRLNGPGSGGNGTDYSTMFNRSPSSSFDFQWKDFTPFFAPLDNWIDSTMDALGELATVLDEVFGKDYNLNLDFGTNAWPVPTLEKAKQWLNDLLQGSPYMIGVGVEELPSFGEVLSGIWERIKTTLLDPSPVMVDVQIYDPQPQLSDVLTNVQVFLENLSTSSVEAYEGIRISLSEKVNSISEATSTAFETMKEKVTNAVVSTKESVDSVYENIRDTLVTKTTEMAQRVSEGYERIRSSIGISLSNAHTNITVFVRSTMSSFARWSANVADSARAAFVNIAQNVYLALTNAGENIAAFINTTSENIWAWANNTASNFAEWAKGVANSVGDALSSAWESFKEFMKATGEAVSGWWSRNKTWVVPVTIGAAITVAAVALAPATGGVSLGAIAFAADGGLFNDGQLFVAREAGPELVGSFGSHTAVANNEQIIEGIARGVSEANQDVVTAIYATGTRVENAVNSKDLSIDGKTLARNIYRPLQSVGRSVGNSLVEGVN